MQVLESSAVFNLEPCKSGIYSASVTGNCGSYSVAKGDNFAVVGCGVSSGAVIVEVLRSGWYVGSTVPSPGHVHVNTI